MENQVNTNSWLFIASSVNKCIKSFGLFGLVVGVIHVLGYKFFGQANIGTELLQEHIAFCSLASICAFLLVSKLVIMEFPVLGKKSLVLIVMNYFAATAVGIGSSKACVIFGVAASAVLFGEYSHAAKFVHVGVYFASFAEAAANLARPSGVSICCAYAVAMIIATPFIFAYVY